ncbi:diguanylate cyclase domain-containing protein [Pseudooctadecabacter jejudonensis]|uniref:diguanylate cyclase n=1 Tax=Pseudooctadecabacter jejudonensis TaxID=1391910 RepID=A0A1Y5S363_9RHOB|nr:diguanylate cyclase [Pseudooctadecabacter jejudonensis]SLN28677.1 putative diguanylate cyclase YedQ [Pseudooctadecabacter jejudonensis]
MFIVTFVRIFNLLVGNPRTLWRRYLLAMLFVGVFIAGSHLAQMRAVEAAAQDATIINVAGKQRMLSQRILLLALTPEEERTPASDAALEQALWTFSTSNDWLVNRPHMSDITRAHYVSEGDLDQMSRAYIDLTRRVLTEPDGARLLPVLQQASVPLLASLDRAVNLWETDARGRTDALTNQSHIMLAIACTILILEGLLIFLPAQYSVRRTLAEMERSHEEITAKTQRIEAIAEDLHHAAFHDTLTGLANRAQLFSVLEQALDGWLDSGAPVAVIQIDLDHFKAINDTYGHPAGDYVLQEASRRMAELVRPQDLVARMGGDEFVVVAPFKHWEDVNEQLEAMGQAMIAEISRGVQYDGIDLTLGATIGAALAGPSAKTSDELIAAADHALYLAKNAGRGRLCIGDFVYEPPLGDVAA